MTQPPREPTSHERSAGQAWEASYADGPAPWDIGMPQPAVVCLASAGAFTGRVLDAGCGTGENALHLASLGLPVFGFDVAETAITLAREKAEQRGFSAEFEVADALQFDRLARAFDSVLDCGLFHTFDAEERVRYALSLASVTKRGGVLYVLSFSDEGEQTGPHPVRRDEFAEAFDASSGWGVVAAKPERLQTRFHDERGAPAWCAKIERI